MEINSLLELFMDDLYFNKRKIIHDQSNIIIY